MTTKTINKPIVGFLPIAQITDNFEIVTIVTLVVCFGFLLKEIVMHKYHKNHPFTVENNPGEVIPEIIHEELETIIASDTTHYPYPNTSTVLQGNPSPNDLLDFYINSSLEDYLTTIKQLPLPNFTDVPPDIPFYLSPFFIDYIAICAASFLGLYYLYLRFI